MTDASRQSHSGMSLANNAAKPLQTGISPVPTLDAIVKQPDLVEHLPLDACEHLFVQAATLQARLVTRIARAGAVPADGSGDLLDAQTAAKLLGLARDTLYRKVRRDPAYRAMTVDNGTDRIVFDPQRVKAFTKRRMR